MYQAAPNVEGVSDPTLSLAPRPAALRREFEDLVLGDLLGPAGGADETRPIGVRDATSGELQGLPPTSRAGLSRRWLGRRFTD